MHVTLGGGFCQVMRLTRSSATLHWPFRARPFLCYVCGARDMKRARRLSGHAPGESLGESGAQASYGCAFRFRGSLIKTLAQRAESQALAARPASSESSCVGKRALCHTD